MTKQFKLDLGDTPLRRPRRRALPADPVADALAGKFVVYLRELAGPYFLYTDWKLDGTLQTARNRIERIDLFEATQESVAQQLGVKTPSILHKLRKKPHLLSTPECYTAAPIESKSNERWCAMVGSSPANASRAWRGRHPEIATLATNARMFGGYVLLRYGWRGEEQLHVQSRNRMHGAAEMVGILALRQFGALHELPLPLGTIVKDMADDRNAAHTAMPDFKLSYVAPTLARMTEEWGWLAKLPPLTHDNATMVGRALFAFADEVVSAASARTTVSSEKLRNVTEAGLDPDRPLTGPWAKNFFGDDDPPFSGPKSGR